MSEDYTYVFLPGVATEVSAGVATAQLPSSGVEDFAYTLSLTGDSSCEGDETFIVTASVAGLEGKGTASFTIMEHPDDVEGCGLEIGEIAPVTEGGAVTYTLALKSRPTAPVTVVFGFVGDVVAASGEEVRLVPSSGSLVFLPGNWDSPQIITVHTTDNEFAEGPRDLEISYVASGGKYDDFPFASTVTILDDDVVSTRVDLSLSRSFASEPLGYRARRREDITVWAALNAAPRSEITTVTLSLLLNLEADTADVTVSFPEGDTIEIPAGERTGAIQVRLDFFSGTDVVEENKRFTILGRVLGGGLDGGAAIFTIIESSVRGLKVEHSGADVPEGTGFGISLGLFSEPTADVTLYISLSEAEGVAISLSNNIEAAFTPNYWDGGHALFSIEDNDHIQQRRTSVTINVVASGGDYEGIRASLTFVVIDDEPESTTITLSLLDENMEKLEQLEVEEGGGPVKVYVVAETSRTLYVDVPIDILIYGSHFDYSLTPVDASLHIPAGEKRGMAEFWLTPTDDDIDEDDETFYLYGRPSGKAWNLIASIIARASFRIIDDDSRAVIVTPTALKVPEGGGRRTYSVRLGSQPVGGDVSVEITKVTRAPAAGQDDRSLYFFQDPAASAKIRSAHDSVNGQIINIGNSFAFVLTFTAANWFEEQLVYVNMEKNSVPQLDSDATVNHSVSGGGYNDETVPDVALTLTEFDFLVSDLSSADDVLSEGGSGRYSISLLSAPAHAVTMRVILPPNPGISLSLTISELIFSTENWGTQFVTVDYVDDDLSSGDRTLEIAHIAVSDDPAYDSEGGTVAVVRVNTKDGEELPRLRLLLSPSSAVEGDGGSDGSQRTQTIDITVTAELDGPARTEETIVFLSLGPNAAAAGPGGYTPTLAADAFLVIPPRAARSTGGAQHSRVTVTLTLIRDFIDEEDETFAIIGRADGLYDGSATFTIIDDDVRGLEIGEIAEVTEGGAISYTLALRSRPTGTVTVEFRTTGSAEVAISQSLLVFSTTNWHIPQEITVSAIENNIAEGPPRDVTITYVVSGGDYADFPLVASTVTILDNDVASTRVDLSLNPSSAEEGRVIGITVTAVLNALPRSQLTAVQLSVRQNLGADEGADFTLDFSNGMTIEIPSGEISASIVVSLELIDDDIYDRGEKFAILGSVVGGGLAGGSAMFTIIDNDRYGIEVSPTTLDVTEGGAGREYSVALLSQPTAPVTVELDVMVAEGVGVRLSDISLNGQPPFSPLLFDPEDWATPQIVTVEVAENNHIQQRPTVVTITHTVLGGDYAGFKLSPTTVNIADDEPDKTDVTLSLLDESQRNLEELEEGDGPATVYVAAEISPTLYVDVPIALTYDGGTADADDYTLTPVGAPLLIRAGETRGTAMFRLTLNDDRIDEENETVEIVGAASGDAANFIASITPVSFSILDDDTRGVIIEASALTVSESKGGSITFSVRLRSEPYGDGGDESVQVGIMNIVRAPEDIDEGRRLRFSDGSTLMTSLHNGTVVGNLVLTFTKDDWEEPQTVNVELSDDDDRLQEDSVATILHSVSGADYDTVTVPPVVLTLKQFGFFVTDPTPADVSEGGTASYDIRLTSRPENTVRVRVILPPNPSIDLSRSSGVLTFTTGNWNVPQPVIVEYVNDDVSTGNQTLEITHTAESNDANYNGAPVAAVSLNFTDDVGDLPRLTLRLSPSSAGEGNGGSERDDSSDGDGGIYGLPALHGDDCISVPRP